MDDLNDLAYFAAVAEHGGFAPAGRALGIPKSKLSRRVTQLEAHLGVRLLQRTSRRFALTDVGEGVLQHARAMRSEAEAAAALAHEQTREPRGGVSLSCPPALLHTVVGEMLARFLHAWPQVRLQVSATNRHVDVWNDGVDLALRVRDPDAVLPAEEIVRPLAVAEHLLVCAPRMLANAAPPGGPQDLSGLPTLGLGNSPEQARWKLRSPAGETVEVPLTPRLVVDDMDALQCAALAGVGCAVLPRLLAHDALQRGDLLHLLPGWAPPPGQIQAVVASRRGMRAAVRQLLDALAREFDELVRQGRCLRAR